MTTQTWGRGVRRQLNTTTDHTKKVVRKLVRLATNMDRFKEEHKLKSDIALPVGDAERDYLVLAAFVHDVYKVLDGLDHADRGADFASLPETIDLIRFHDILGVVNTGEASSLFLGDLVSAVRDHASPWDFLRRLLLLTTVDVAAAGFLTQERLDSYAEILGLVREAGGTEVDRLSEPATNETAERIKRLLESNDRIEVPDIKAIKAALKQHRIQKKLRAAMASARFHYGAWVLEPWFWCESGRPEPTPKEEHKTNKVCIGKTKSHARRLHRFLNLLWRIFNDKEPWVKRTSVRIGGRELDVYNLEAHSVKFEDSESYEEFIEWRKRNRRKAKGRKRKST